MSEISNLIDKQAKEITENTPDIFKENIGEPPEDKESKRIYLLKQGLNFL